jgi:hypothetical protein
MNAIRLIKQLDAAHLGLPELAPLAGQSVEIIVLPVEQKTESPRAPRKPRKPGSAKGQIKMSPDFDNPALVEPDKSQPQPRVFGSGKGTVLYIADDFDAPLEDCKEYME